VIFNTCPSHKNDINTNILDLISSTQIRALILSKPYILISSLLSQSSLNFEFASHIIRLFFFRKSCPENHTTTSVFSFLTTLNIVSTYDSYTDFSLCIHNLLYTFDTKTAYISTKTSNMIIENMFSEFKKKTGLQKFLLSKLIPFLNQVPKDSAYISIMNCRLLCITCLFCCVLDPITLEKSIVLSHADFYNILTMSTVFKKTSYFLQIFLSKNIMTFAFKSNNYEAEYIILIHIITLLKNQDSSDLLKHELENFRHIIWFGIKFYHKLFLLHLENKSLTKSSVAFIIQEGRQKIVKNMNLCSNLTATISILHNKYYLSESEMETQKLFKRKNFHFRKYSISQIWSLIYGSFQYSIQYFKKSKKISGLNMSERLQSILTYILIIILAKMHFCFELLLNTKIKRNLKQIYKSTKIEETFLVFLSICNKLSKINIDDESELLFFKLFLGYLTKSYHFKGSVSSLRPTYVLNRVIKAKHYTQIKRQNSNNMKITNQLLWIIYNTLLYWLCFGYVFIDLMIKTENIFTNSYNKTKKFSSNVD
jgi:hypothetical protein